MNPWELTLMLLGWGVLAIVAFTLAVILVALIRAIPSIWRKPPKRSTRIFKSPAE